MHIPTPICFYKKLEEVEILSWKTNITIKSSGEREFLSQMSFVYSSLRKINSSSEKQTRL
jgi:hypothetical protein